MTEPITAPTDTLKIKYKKDKLRILHTSQTQLQNYAKKKGRKCTSEEHKNGKMKAILT
jgi:hypothetical protein